MPDAHRKSATGIKPMAGLTRVWLDGSYSLSLQQITFLTSIIACLGGGEFVFSHLSLRNTSVGALAFSFRVQGEPFPLLWL